MSNLAEVRKQITFYQNENAKLTTKIVRNRKVIVQKKETYDLVKSITEEEDYIDSDSTQSSFKIKQLPNGMDKVRELYKTLCQCGAAAKFNGFCEDCVKKMKEEYEKALNEFYPIQQQYQNCYTNNVNKGVKLAAVKQKIQNMQDKLKKGELKNIDNDIDIMHEELNYLRKQIKIAEKDYELQMKEFSRYLEEQNKAQENLEIRLAKKDDKLQKLKESINEVKQKIKKTEENIIIVREELESYLK